jgi:hypothetical protein
LRIDGEEWVDWRLRVEVDWVEGMGWIEEMGGCWVVELGGGKSTSEVGVRRNGDRAGHNRR